MPETAKEHTKRWWPVILSCALLIGTAMWVSVFIPQGSARATPEVTEAAFPQTLCVRDGRLLRLASDGETVLEEYDVAVLSLPIEEQERLERGVRVDSEAELAGVLENYLS